MVLFLAGVWQGLLKNTPRTFLVFSYHSDVLFASKSSLQFSVPITEWECGFTYIFPEDKDSEQFQTDKL